MTATPTHAEPVLEESVDIAAPPEAVWALVTDLPRMSRWSPQVVHTRVSRGGVRLGARAVNLNHRGLLVWPTRSTVVRFDPPHDFAFRVRENTTIWGFRLEPVAAGTRLVQTREAPEGISAVSSWLTRTLLGGKASFTDELRSGMRQTLARIKAEAERLAG